MFAITDKDPDYLMLFRLVLCMWKQKEDMLFARSYYKATQSLKLPIKGWERIFDINMINTGQYT